MAISKKSIAALLFGVLLSLFMIEILLRAAEWATPKQARNSAIAGLPYENNPGIGFWRFDREAGLNYYSHNKLGLRGRELPLEKPRGKIRIALLGDSVVHGGNVTQGKTTADCLERLLNQDKSQSPFEVLNFGCAGYGITEYEALLKGKIFDFHPDLIMVGLCLNDYAIPGRDNFWTYQESEKTAASKINLRSVLSNSRFLKFLYQSLLRGRPKALAGQSDPKDERLMDSVPGLTAKDATAIKRFCAQHKIPPKAYYEGLAAGFEFMNKAAWDRNEPIIRRMTNLAARRGIGIVFYAYPLAMQVLPGYESRMPQDYIKELIERNHGQYIELLDGFRGYVASHPSEKLYPVYDIMHLFASGHLLAAEILAESIEAQLPVTE